MIRKITFLFFTIFCMLSAKAGFIPIPVTGFNKDVVANGTGPFRSSAVSVDDKRDTAGYSFNTQDYRSPANVAPTYFLPQNGLITSPVTAGVTYQLANYTGNNSLRLDSTGSFGTLTLNTPVNVSDLYLLATAGGAGTVNTANADVLITFTDNTTATATLAVRDWFNFTPVVVQGIGRVAMSDGGVDNGSGATNPRLYEYKITLATTNWSKAIQSIKFTRTNAFGLLHIMAVSANTVPPCGPPASQPAGLVLTPTVYGITGTFTATVPPADKYMVLRSPSTAPADTPPTDGVVYVVGQTLGNATILSISAATTFFDPGLAIGSTYTYTILGYNDAVCFGALTPAYNIVLPTIGSATIPACAPTPAGTYTVGPTGTYLTLYAAMTALNNAAGAAGNIIVELQSTYTSAAETFPIVIPNISTSPCAVGNPTLTIRPATGATGLVITGSNATTIIDFNNAKRAMLDGRPAGAGTTIQLSVINTNAAGVAIRLFNDASNNTITYCDVQGQNTSSTSSALSGVIYVGQALSATSAGNDYNTISFSRIHGTVTGTPAIGICAFGTTPAKAGYNDSCAILNCNIYDFFSATTATAGVKVDVGNTAWTISNNSVYQTTARTYTTASSHRGLWITPNASATNDSTASNFSITNNFIGGSAANAGGSAYNMLGAVANLFYGIDVSPGSGAATSVQNNTIANIAVTSTGISTTTGVFAGINIANGNTNIGKLVGNTIGSTTVPGSINIISGASGTSYGVRVVSGVTTNITNNTITGITASGTAGGTTSTNFTGIAVAGGSTVNMTNNIIGSPTVANSINLAASSSTTAQSLVGISITGAATTAVTNNTIANLSNAYTSTGAGGTRGISVTTSTCTITGNTIRNLSSATTTTSGGATSSLLGIAVTSTSGACNIISNTIHSLISNTTVTNSPALNFTGIFFQGSTAATSYIIKNNIHSFDAPLDTNITMTGVDFATGTAVVANNFIRLGIKPDGNSFTSPAVIRGISSNSGSALNSILYNSIYIGGTGVGTNVRNSYAFIRTAASGTYDIRNNLFVNTRSNVSTGGKHYALLFTTATTGATPNYNVYLANGTGGVFANNGVADVATYTGGWLAGDANSAYGNPGFINANGNAAIVDLHINATTPSIAESAGSPAAFISDDYDGTNRSATAPDAGADEFVGINPNICTGTPVSGIVNASQILVCPGISFTLSVAGATGTPGIGYQWQSSPDSTNWTNISSANTSTLTTSQTVATYYRIVVRCGNSSLSANSAGIRVLITAPVYAIYNGTLYTEGFENWVSSCSTTDLPGVSWTNIPSTGNNSWRRNDQAANAGWVNPTFGIYAPTFTTGAFSARFHTYQSASGTQGILNFYVNMSAAGSSTNIKFDYINTTGNDSLTVLISTNGGTTFTRLDSVGVRTAWRTKTINITSNAAATVIRLLATSDFGTTDIGIDNFQLVNFVQCTGTPNAGTVSSSTTSVCSGTSFTLSNTTASQLAGITYQWQSSPDSTNWTNITGANGLSYTANLTTTLYYRLVVSCNSSGLTANSPGFKVSLSAPNTCYCTPTYSSGGTNDYVTILAFENLLQATPGNTTPYYINYTTTQNAIPSLARNATYPLYLTFGNDGNQYSGVWIDFNQDGIFATTEYFSRARNATALGKDTISVLIPATAFLGITRMRMRGGEDAALTSAQACGASSSAFGQAQDYLVNITTGTVPIKLLSFAGERRGSGNLLNWITASEVNNKGFELQRSADGINFIAVGFVASNAINGNSNSNIGYSFFDAKALTGNNYYRLKQIDKDGKFEYSMIVLLKGDKPNALTISAVYPNPVKTILNLIIASPKANKLTLLVSDVTGRIVFEQRVNAVSGDNKFEINLHTLTTGNYVIKAVCDEGCETVISRFIKQ